MNTRPILDSSSGPFALSTSFNSDTSCFSVALESGFRIFSSKNGNVKTAREVGGGIGCAEMVGTTKYVALVGGGKQPKFPQNKVSPEDTDWVFADADTHKVQIWNDEKEVVSTSLEFKTSVQRVRISQKYLIVVLLNNVGIYKLKIPPEKVADYETVNNPFGLCSLGDKIVAFPGRMIGQVRLYNTATGNNSIITAHEAPLQAIALSPKEDMVATASEKGTLVRLWSFPSCTKIAEFRRGVDPATIFSLAFSPFATMLAVTSDKSTLHIFDLPNPGTTSTDPDPNNHKWGFLSKMPLLPRQFSDTYASASTKFELGDEPGAAATSKSATHHAAISGVPGGRPTKGLIGWLDDHTIVIVGAGQDARWEKFVVGNANGKRFVGKEGWKKYLE